MTEGTFAASTARAYALLVLVVILCAGIFLSCRHNLQAKNNEASDPRSGPVKIGVCMSVAGPLAEVSRLQAEGVKMALEMGKGKSSRPVELLFRDVDTTPQGFSQTLQKLLREDKVSGIISNVPADLIAKAGGVMKQDPVPFIATSFSGLDWKTKEVPSVVRMCVGLDDQAYACSRFMTDEVRARRIGLVVNDRDEDSVRLASLFSAALVKTGGRIEDIAYIKPGQDPTQAITRLLGKNPDAVYIPVSGADIRSVLMKIRSLDKVKPLLVGNLLIEETFLRKVDKSFDGIYVQTNYLEETVKSALGKEFISYYYKHAPKRAYLGSNIATGAEAYFLVLDIISRRPGADQKEALTVSPLWKPSLLGITLDIAEGAVKNRLSFGQIKRNFFGSVTLRHVTTITVPRSDPVTHVGAQ